MLHHGVEERGIYPTGPTTTTTGQHCIGSCKPHFLPIGLGFVSKSNVLGGQSWRQKRGPIEPHDCRCDLLSPDLTGTRRSNEDGGGDGQDYHPKLAVPLCIMICEANGRLLAAIGLIGTLQPLRWAKNV